MLLSSAMRATRTVTISLAPDVAAEVDRLAQVEGRTRSELLREAFRQYLERRQRWDRLFSAGERAAAKHGMTEETVRAAVKRRRQARRTGTNSSRTR